MWVGGVGWGHRGVAAVGVGVAKALPLFGYSIFWHI